MGSRRRAREYALQMLYQADLRDSNAEEVLATFWMGVDSDIDERSFAEMVLRDVLRLKHTLDEEIERHATRWKVSRMALVDRNILRIGVLELFHRPDIPVSVTLNEAIELGKRYSTPDSGSFINGVLDKIARQVPEEMRKHGHNIPGLDDEDEGLEFDDEEVG